MSGQFRKVVVARPVVGREVRTGLHRVQHEALQRFCRAVRSDAKTEAPSVGAAPTRERFAGISFPLFLVALALLDRSYDQRLVVRPTPLTTRPPPDPGLVDLDREVTSDAVAIRTHHGHTELVQDLEGHLIALCSSSSNSA